MSGEDAAKLLVFVLVGAGLLGLGRWSSQLGANESGDSLVDAPVPDIKEIVRTTKPDRGRGLRRRRKLPLLFLSTLRWAKSAS
jgi:hypothetical protein